MKGRPQISQFASCGVHLVGGWLSTTEGRQIHVHPLLGGSSGGKALPRRLPNMKS